ncbi:MAG: hypothetical protein AAB368_09230, partial [bacterium]
MDVRVEGVGIGPGEDRHPRLPAAAHEVAERIAVAEPRAAVVERHRRRVVRHDPARREAGALGMDAFEVADPERRV